MLKEDEQERRNFDSVTTESHGGDPLAAVQTALTILAKNAPPNGSYGCMLAIFANEVAKARARAAAVDGRTYTQADVLEAVKAERYACSIAVWMTLQDALEPDADDKGLDGWMREAEQRVKNRLAHHGPEA